MREDGFLPLTAVRPLLELFVKGVEMGAGGRVRKGCFGVHRRSLPYT